MWFLFCEGVHEAAPPPALHHQDSVAGALTEELFKGNNFNTTIYMVPLPHLGLSKIAFFDLFHNFEGKFESQG